MFFSEGPGAEDTIKTAAKPASRAAAANGKAKPAKPKRADAQGSSRR